MSNLMKIRTSLTRLILSSWYKAKQKKWVCHHVYGSQSLRNTCATPRMTRRWERISGTLMGLGSTLVSTSVAICYTQRTYVKLACVITGARSETSKQQKRKINKKERKEGRWGAVCVLPSTMDQCCPMSIREIQYIMQIYDGSFRCHMCTLR